jgi:hypothetical protein
MRVVTLAIQPEAAQIRPALPYFDPVCLDKCQPVTVEHEADVHEEKSRIRASKYKLLFQQPAIQ